MANDQVSVGTSFLGTNEAPGQALGATVTFGNGATATLFVGDGTVSTFRRLRLMVRKLDRPLSTPNIGQTNVKGAEAGMVIDFHSVTTSNLIAEREKKRRRGNGDDPHGQRSTRPSRPLGAPGVAYFNYQSAEYFIATNSTETSVSATDAVVHLVGVSLNATIADGVVTLA